MPRVPLRLEGVTAEYDAGANLWRVSVDGRLHVLRAWRWGERQRLVQACARAGRFDGDAFAEGLVRLLFEPEPPEALTALYAYVALRLLGVEPGMAVRPLAAGEALLAERFGWRPGDLEQEFAGALDRLLATVDPPVAAPRLGGGWTSIRISE
jgi:hypothetical protein